MSIAEQHARQFVPQHTLDSLDRYVNKKLLPGGFLIAVLSNDLFSALTRADLLNRENLYHTCYYIYNYVPSECWGSPEAVDRWLNRTDK